MMIDAVILSSPPLRLGVREGGLRGTTGSSSWTDRSQTEVGLRQKAPTGRISEYSGSPKHDLDEHASGVGNTLSARQPNNANVIGQWFPIGNSRRPPSTQAKPTAERPSIPFPLHLFGRFRVRGPLFPRRFRLFWPPAAHFGIEP